MIELTRDELSRCQIGTLNIKRSQNIKYLPFAFTERHPLELVRLLPKGRKNESTRMQLDAISTALAELQAKPSEPKTRNPIGFIQPEDDYDKK